MSLLELSPGPEDDTINERRRRGEVACAECRRLKIKCSKTIPCESCVRRDCAGLCPTGTHTTAEGTRAVLDATTHLHEQLAALREHRSALQTALAQVHRARSTEPHPLLVSLGALDSDEEGDQKEDDPIDLDIRIGAFSLAESVDGSLQFYGGSPSSLALKQHTSTSMLPTGSSADLPRLESDLLRCVRQFPFPLGGPPVSATLAQLRLYLPSSLDARELVQIFFTQFGSLFYGISQPHVQDVLLPVAYTPVSTAETDAHKLGLLFVIFAIASLMHTPVAERLAVTSHYAQLSLAALGALSIFEKPSLETVQAVYLRSILEFLVQNGAEETARTYLSFACQLCYILGLHCDPGEWPMSGDEQEHRRAIFWMVYRGDTWESLSSGRTTRLSVPSVDCRFPEGIYKQPGFPDGHETLAEVIRCTTAVNPPAYSAIINLDMRLRELSASHVRGQDVSETAQYPNISFVLFHLHRVYFARALRDNPANPGSSVYAPSFHAAVRAVREVMDWLFLAYKINPDYTVCFSFAWTTGVTAAVVYAGLIIDMSSRSPVQEGTLHLMKRLDDMIAMFEDVASRGSGRAMHCLPTMRSLREKALASIKQSSIPGLASYHSTGSPWALDELLSSRPTSGSSSHIGLPGPDSGRSSAASSKPETEHSSPRPGSSARRTAGSSAYPGYLQGKSRSEMTPSSRPRADEGQMTAIIQEATSSARRLSGDTTSADREHVDSSLTGQWYSHVRHMSDVE